MRLTTRGRTVLVVAAFITALTIGYLTANWCWYGYCGL